jgi:hypothetical protein
MQEGPWPFRDCALIIEEFDRSTTTPSVMQTETILKQLAARVGEVERVQMKVASFGSGEFHKARVKLAAEKPMHRIVTFSQEGSESMGLLVKYEKVPKFCNFFGKMRHEHEECGTGEYVKEEL